MKKTILFFAVVSFSAVAGIAENTTKPVALIALKKDGEQYVSLCKTIKIDCENGVSIWKAKDTNDTFYLIAPQLQLVKVKKEGDGYSKAIVWSFSKDNDDESNADDELTKSDVYIYPALYPLNKTKLAIALVSKWSTSYSGGGREEEYANFMVINDDGSYQLAFKNIPFSSQEMIRACFSAEDYARKSHCHDESWSILNLKITDEAKEFYSWKFITKSYSWPAFTDKKSTKVDVREVVAYPFQSLPQSKK